MHYQPAPEQSPYGHYPGNEEDRKPRSSSDKSRKGSSSGGSVSGKSRSGKSRPSTAGRSRRDDE